MAEAEIGVVFPAAEDGSRSTSALGRAVVADALRRVDRTGAAAAERETGWRSGYLGHFRRLVEAGLGSRGDAVAIAADGLSALHDRMRFAPGDGEELPLAAFGREPVGGALDTAVVGGTAE